MKLSNPHYSALSEKLANKIKKELNIECDSSTFRRTYAGFWQRTQGAVVWTMRIKDTPFEVGSCDTASVCVNKKYRLSIIDETNEICADIITDNENKNSGK